MNPSDLKEITSGLDFTENKALVTVPIIEVIDGEVKKQPYVITSSRDKFPLDKKELLAHGLYSFRNPSPSLRWSIESIENYLLGEESSQFKELFDWIAEQYRYYVDFGDPRMPKYMACWVIGTYFHRMFAAYPYIHLNGTAESGKSKTMGITSQLSFNGIMAVNATPAYLVRMIHDNQATCCIDELEYLQRAKDEVSLTVLAMYNAGYKRGAMIGKAEPVGKTGLWEPKEYEAYSPKMFASIKGLETSLASRTIPLEMMRSTSGAIKNREISPGDMTLSQIRNQIYPTFLERFQIIRALYNGIKDTKIVGREWELWKPILTVAKAVDPDCKLYEELRSLAIEIGKNKKEIILDGLVTPKILDCLFRLLTSELNGSGFYSIPRIVEELIAYDEEAFGWLRDASKAGRWVGDELRKAGVVRGPAKPGRDGDVVAKGFDLDWDIIKERLSAFE